MADAAPAPVFSMNGLRTSVLRGDIGLALGIITIIAVLFLPMPSWLLDMSLAISITFSVMILMTVLFIERPLDFSTFPTILLISTMIRLALNIATTRLILTHGHEGHEAAGQVIRAFGGFVMQDNFVIGIIIFAILVIINFVVITKGSGRIAEVAARFSLDAMPGKQMAIDSDLSSGLLTEDEAKKRRAELEQESTFFGAMDGAAKFVRGDAVAGMLIVFINIIGGIIIGTVQHDLSMNQAAENYILLTVGDGLVTQIPALIVSISAGLLVSKAGIVGSADKALFNQLGSNPKPLFLTSALLGAFALLPGLPFLPFAILASVTGTLGYLTIKESRRKSAEAVTAKETAAKAAVPAEPPIAKALAIDLIRLELGYGLLPLVNSEEHRLTEQIKGLRRQLAEEMGFILPSVRIQDNLQLDASSYVVRIKEIEVGRGSVRPNMLLCMDPSGQPISLPGESTLEPTFGLPAMWIDPQHREEANFKGYTVVDPSTVITTHVTELVKDNMADLLSYAETQKLLNELPGDTQKLVADTIPTQISVGGLQRVLQNLVSERVSIRDLASILEGVSEAAQYTKNIVLMTEHVRSRMARQMCDQFSAGSGMLSLVTLAPQWEQLFLDHLVGQGEDRQLAIPPTQLQEFMQIVRDFYDDMGHQGENPVLVVSGGIRPYVRSVIERFRPATIVMSQAEIHSKARIRTLGQIG